MEPRLTTSSKNTTFPPDYIKMIKEVLSRNFKKLCQTHEVHVAGWIYKEEICTQIGFREKGSIRQVNFEASVDYTLKPNNIMDQIYISIDALGSMIGQYYESDGEIEMPKEWHKFDLENKEIHLRTTTINPDLEAQADEILAQSGGIPKPVLPEEEGVDDEEHPEKEDTPGRPQGQAFSLELPETKKKKKKNQPVH